MPDNLEVPGIFIPEKHIKIYVISIFNLKLATHNVLFFNNLQID